ncbi:MoaD family protein [Methanolobus chelungpuianus]|uniref:MoaD family protein n=1 Tax=Methanolobus chelungpuianus TaxID=502115 RepID=UPI0021139955|nr:MoaD family protein [Methanolobus chelungpuianus]
MVSVRFSSALSTITKTRSARLGMGNTTVQLLIGRLVSEYGRELERYLIHEGQLQRFVNVYVNGENIRHLSGLNTEISDADEISILPAISGG